LCEWLWQVKQAQLTGDCNAKLSLYTGAANRKAKFRRRNLRDPETEDVFTYFIEYRHEPSVVGMLPLPCFASAKALAEKQNRKLGKGKLKKSTYHSTPKRPTLPETEEAIANAPPATALPASLGHLATYKGLALDDIEEVEAGLQNPFGHLLVQPPSAAASESRALEEEEGQAPFVEDESSTQEEEDDDEMPTMDQLVLLPFTWAEWQFLRSVGLTYRFPFASANLWMAELLRLLQGLALVVDSWEGALLKVGLMHDGQLQNMQPWFFRPLLSVK
jgi:hypothetical protein